MAASDEESVNIVKEQLIKSYSYKNSKV